MSCSAGLALSMSERPTNGTGQEWNRMFTLSTAIRTNGARIGELLLPGRNAISTPHYIAVTSRGAVPHIAQDVFTDSTAIKGVHMALEDCKCEACAVIVTKLTGSLTKKFKS